MNKKAVFIIVVILLLALAGIIYAKNSCYYQMARIKASAHLDPKACNVEGRPVRVTIQNDSSYALLDFGFSLRAYKDDYTRAVGGYGYTDHHTIPKRGRVESCLSMPEIQDTGFEGVNKDYFFKLRFFIMVFDIGNDKKRICR